MEYLFAMRHGDHYRGYDDSAERLTNSGIDQVINVSKQLEEIVRSKSNTVILSSPRTRCKETADIIAKTLGVSGFEEHPCLVSQDWDEFDDKRTSIYELVMSKIAFDTVIITAHLEIGAFPGYFKRNSSGQRCNYLGQDGLERGEGVLYDVKKGTIELLGGQHE